MILTHRTEYGSLYQADCMDLLRSIETASVHTFFADPPFNLGKDYGVNGSDDLSESAYLDWSKTWLREAVRILVPGGALFVYNLPKWLLQVGAYLNSLDGVTFKHWIFVAYAAHPPKTEPR